MGKMRPKMRPKMARFKYPDAFPQDASFLGTADHRTTLRSSVILKPRLWTVARPCASHTPWVLTRKPADRWLGPVAFQVTAPWGAESPFLNNLRYYSNFNMPAAV